ncbi:hypothetical protein [Actinoplanes sp. NPDC026623]|uniref:hypothetical protein n=1 Tax=Actinoplanes sp. NPDC026623 TaxID=3155610 RepID=UPI00340C4BE9
MNVLLAVVGGGLRIEEVSIPATYLDGNAASNFGSLADSARVLHSLARHAVVQVRIAKKRPASRPR